MKSKIRVYVEALFDGALKTEEVVEVREEILQNVIDKYEDLVADGKSEDEAYRIAVSGIGNINELLQSIGSDRNANGFNPYDSDADSKKVEEADEKNPVVKSINSAIWAVGTVIYFVVSFATGAWFITWLIFCITDSITEVVKAYFLLQSSKEAQ